MKRKKGTGKKALMGSGWRRKCGYMDKGKKEKKLFFWFARQCLQSLSSSIDAAFHKRLINHAPSPSTDITCRSPLIETTSGNAAQLRLRTRSLSPPHPSPLDKIARVKQNSAPFPRQVCVHRKVGYRPSKPLLLVK